MKASPLSALGPDAPRAAAPASSPSSVRTGSTLGPKFESSLSAAQASLARLAPTAAPGPAAGAAGLRWTPPPATSDGATAARSSEDPRHSRGLSRASASADTAVGRLLLSERSIELELDDAPLTTSERLELRAAEPRAAEPTPLAARSEGAPARSRLDSSGAAALAAVAFARNSPRPEVIATGERPLREAPLAVSALRRAPAPLGKMGASAVTEPVAPAAGAGTQPRDGLSQASASEAAPLSGDATALDEHAEPAVPTTFADLRSSTNPPAATLGATRAASASPAGAPAPRAPELNREAEAPRPLPSGPTTASIGPEPRSLTQARLSAASLAQPAELPLAAARAPHAELRTERAAGQAERTSPAPLAALAGWATPSPAVLPAAGGAVAPTASAPITSRPAVPQHRAASPAAELPTPPAAPPPRNVATPAASLSAARARDPNPVASAATPPTFGSSRAPTPSAPAITSAVTSAPGGASTSQVSPAVTSAASGPVPPTLNAASRATSPTAPATVISAVGASRAPSPVAATASSAALGSSAASGPISPAITSAAIGATRTSSPASTFLTPALSSAVRPSPSDNGPSTPRSTARLNAPSRSTASDGEGAVFAAAATAAAPGAPSARAALSPRAPASARPTAESAAPAIAPLGTSVSASESASRPAPAPAPMVANRSAATAARGPARSTEGHLSPAITPTPVGHAQSTGQAVADSSATEAQAPVLRAATSARSAPTPATTASLRAADEPTSSRPAPSERPIRARTGETDAAVLAQSGVTAPFVRSTQSFDTKVSDLKPPAPTTKTEATAQPSTTPQHTLDGIVARSKALSETLRVSTPAQPPAAARRPAVEELAEPESKRKAHGDEPAAPALAPTTPSTASVATPAPPSAAAEPPPSIPAPLEPYVAQLVDDPSAHLSLTNTGARLSVDTPEAGRLSVQLKVTDGVTDVRASGPAAPMLDARQNELRLALAQEGLSLGQFDLGQQERRRERPEAPDAPPAPRSPRATRTTSDAVTADGRVHVKA